MTTLLRAMEANELAAGICDERVRAFVRFGLTTIITKSGMAAAIHPQTDFDLLVFAEALRAMATNHGAMLRIFTGVPSSMEWWPEEDQ